MKLYVTEIDKTSPKLVLPRSNKCKCVLYSFEIVVKLLRHTKQGGVYLLSQSIQM